MVLDFANEADEIKAAFEPYYETTLLSEATDPNLLYEIQTRLAAFPVYTEADVDGFRQGLLRPQGDAGPALRRARARGRALPGALPRRSSTTSAVSSPTTCGSTPSSPRC